MFIQLSKNSFVRILSEGKIGYIRNQLYNIDNLYNETGADFLKELSRNPQSIESIVTRLLKIYDIDKETLENHFVDFVDDLVKQNYVIVGDTPEELTDTSFTYKAKKPKTSAYQFENYTEHNVPTTQKTISGLLEEVPHLWSIQIEITGRCNERCIHCYIPNSCKDLGKDMSFELFSKIIEEFSLMGGLHVTLTGGEALLHKDFVRMLRLCREKDLEITLLSNLTKMTDEIVSALKVYNVNMVNVSLYSIDNETHDRITMLKGSCQKTKNAIETLVAHDIPVQISCPIISPNKNSFQDVIKYAGRLKTKASIDYNIVAEKNHSKNNLNCRLSLDEIPEVIRKIVEFRKDYVRFLEDTPLDSSKTDNNAHPCGAAFSTINITSSGEVNPCSTWGESLGNVSNHSLSDIWEKSERINEIRSVTYADFPECQKCSSADYCMTCMAKNFSESGDPMKLNKYFCKVAQINKSVAEEWRRVNDR